MHVTLLTYTPDPERTVACAARLCYSAVGIDGVLDKLTDEKTASFVDMLAEIGHESPIEHASFTFGIEGVSRSLLAQITRHRIASFSVQSQRYVAENRFEYVLPPEIEALPEAAALFRRAMEENQTTYLELTRLLKDTHKKELIDAGMEEKAYCSIAEKTNRLRGDGTAEMTLDVMLDDPELAALATGHEHKMLMDGMDDTLDEKPQR